MTVIAPMSSVVGAVEVPGRRSVTDSVVIGLRPLRQYAGVAAPVGLDLAAGVMALMTTAALTRALALDTAAVLTLAWVALGVGLRRSTTPGVAGGLRSGIPRLRVVLRSGGLLGLGCWVVSTLAPRFGAADQFLTFTAVTTVASVFLGTAHQRLHPLQPTRVVLVGGIEAVTAMLPELRRAGDLDVLAACLSGPQPPGSVPEISMTHGLEHLPTMLIDLAPDAVIALPGPGLDPKTLRTLGWRLEGIGTPLLVGTGVVGLAAHRTTSARAGDIGLLHVRPVRHGGCGRLAKHAWERVAAGAALVLLAPCLLALCLAVRRDSPGPALFRQTRIGRDGRPFVMLKLRTMTIGSDDLVATLRTEHGIDQVLFKMADDPRVTSLGRMLRRYSLDEVPQLLNVVLGQMSLVGPRPALPDEVLAYDEYPLRRLVVKPGLTGLWQVSGRSDLSFEDAVRLDLDYVDNWSLSRDFAIVMRTVGAVVNHRGAY